MYRIKIAAAAALALTLGACSALPEKVAPLRCNTSEVVSASTVRDLREIAERCKTADAYFAAVDKLNRFPAPEAPPLRLSPAPNGRTPAIEATYEVDIYYDFLQAYPSSVALNNLHRLLARIEKAYRIDEVEIVGANDASEAQLSHWKIATRRSEFVEGYLKAAGMNPDTRITIKERPPSRDDTPDGRARDRVVALKVKTAVAE